MWHWVLFPSYAGRCREVTRLHWATGSPGPAGPLEWLGFIYKLAINIWPSFILIHSFLAQMEWILNLVGQGHPHAACLALAAKLFFILQGELKKKESGVAQTVSSNEKHAWKRCHWTPGQGKDGEWAVKDRVREKRGGWKGRKGGSQQQPPEWFICQIRTQWVDYESSNKRECLGTH